LPDAGGQRKKAGKRSGNLFNGFEKVTKRYPAFHGRLRVSQNPPAAVKLPVDLRH